MSEVRDFLLEIGVEEMPSAPLNAAMAQLPKLFSAALKQTGLSFGDIEVHSTPRRLALIAHNVATRIESQTNVMRGPAASIAFDAEGNPTKAALGFARGKGLDASDLEVKTDADGKEYVFATVITPEALATDILAEVSQKVIGELSWSRSQRWGRTTVKFVRPIRWIVALFGSDELEVTYGPVVSGSETEGHRVLAPGSHKITSPAEYREVLRSAYVMLEDERRLLIEQQIKQIEDARGGAEVILNQKVLNEVINLCEWPSVLVGTFDKEFLEVPCEIAKDTMLSNQRYFPMNDAEGNFTNEFVVVSNADPKVNDTVRYGNERVIRARLEDAKFFYNEDLKVGLDEFRARLERVVFQQELGTVLQKVERIEDLSCAIADAIELDAAAKDAVMRGAHLCKSDLVSQTVIEFTSQQGIMGSYFAAAQGEDPVVSEIIKGHYLPRFAGDVLPETLEAKIVAAADRIDTMCGMFAIGQPPTGSSDPFAVRRAAIGLIALCCEMPAFDLSKIVDYALDLYENQGLKFNKSEVKNAISDFIVGRLRSQAQETGIESDTVSAIAFVGASYPQEFMDRANALQEARNEAPELFGDLAAAYTRASHLADMSLGIDVNESMLDVAEKALFDACESAKQKVQASLDSHLYKEALSVLATLREPIDTFFAEVLVMDKDLALQQNRLRLLNRFTSVFDGVALIGEIDAKKS